MFYGPCSLGIQGAIKYEQDELAACKSLVDQCLSDDPDTIISYASISFKEQGPSFVDKI